jgi:hypothetical protein
MKWTATLLRTSPRYVTWLRVFGDATVPVESARTVRNSAPGQPEKEFYKLDVAALSREQRARLVAHLAERFGEAPALVEQYLDDPAHGCPILAEDVAVPIPLRLLV